MNYYHANVRVLPFDDQLAATTADDRLTWIWMAGGEAFATLLAKGAFCEATFEL